MIFTNLFTKKYSNLILFTEELIFIPFIKKKIYQQNFYLWKVALSKKGLSWVHLQKESFNSILFKKEFFVIYLEKDFFFSYQFMKKTFNSISYQIFKKKKGFDRFIKKIKLILQIYLEKFTNLFSKGFFPILLKIVPNFIYNLQREIKCVGKD